MTILVALGIYLLLLLLIWGFVAGANAKHDPWEDR